MRSIIIGSKFTDVYMYTSKHQMYYYTTWIWSNENIIFGSMYTDVYMYTSEHYRYYTTQVLNHASYARNARTWIGLSLLCSFICISRAINALLCKQFKDEHNRLRPNLNLVTCKFFSEVSLYPQDPQVRLATILYMYAYYYSIPSTYITDEKLITPNIPNWLCYRIPRPIPLPKLCHS